MRNTTSSLTGTTDASVAGEWFYIGNMAKMSMIAVVSGDAGAGGKLVLNVSNDAAPAGSQMPFTPTLYAQYATNITVSGNGTSITAPFDVAHQWAQLAFVRTSGSGGAFTVELAGHD